MAYYTKRLLDETNHALLGQGYWVAISNYERFHVRMRGKAQKRNLLTLAIKPESSFALTSQCNLFPNLSPKQSAVENFQFFNPSFPESFSELTWHL